MDPRYRIVLAQPHHIAALAAIERDAARLLRGHAPDSVLEGCIPERDLIQAREQGRLWVAVEGEIPVGFALVRMLADDLPHLEEMDVASEHGRRGIGAALLRAVCDWALRSGYHEITLTTFRAPPWNMPFCGKHGFEEVPFDERRAEIEAVVRDETRRGLDPAGRVVMRHRVVLPAPTIEEIWRRYDAIESRLTAPLSQRMVDLAGLRPGMHVLDLATGRGEPALLAARRVGPRGSVWGVDVSGGMLQMARDKAAAEGLSNLDLRVSDAESPEGIPPGHFHAVTVRWGLMYMTAPIVVLANARRALLPGGVLVAALWAEPERVPYYTLPRRLLARYRSIPALDPEAPGIFRYGTLERIVRDFNQAGFTIDHVEDMDVPVFEAETTAACIAWTRVLGSGLGALLNDLPRDVERAWEQDLASELEGIRTDGVIRLGGVTRIVRARPS